MMLMCIYIHISYIAVVKIFHRWRFDASEVKLELLPPGQERREMPIVNRFNHHLMNVSGRGLSHMQDSRTPEQRNSSRRRELNFVIYKIHFITNFI